MSLVMKHRSFPFLCLSLFLYVSCSLSAAVRLPSIVSDGMVLQRDVSLKIWGWADPGESVTVNFRSKDYSTTACDEGKWQIVMDAQSAGGPDSMTVSGSNKIVLNDILVGDVWFCSGQSNMTHMFNRWQERYAKEIASSKNSMIRQYQVPTKPVLSGPIEDIPGLKWQQADPDTLLNFTVVGYFFAKQLHETYQVPQGIIMSCVGGTRIEAWTSEEGFQEFPDILETIAQNKDSAYVERVNAEAQADREADGPRIESDKGLIGETQWFDPNYQARDWKRIAVPGYWEDQGVRDLNGVVWYRREIELSCDYDGAAATLKLGRIVDADTVYVNGQQVGKTTYQYPQRKYKIPEGVLKAGKNLLVVRLVNFGGKGGFVPDKPYALEIADESIDLAGYWSYKVGDVFRPRRPYKRAISSQEQASSLYNGMVAPFVNFGIRGTLWYQGESNSGNPEDYAVYLPNLIEDWRAHWALGDQVFLIAQLPNYMAVDYLPVESNWALMREVQLHTALHTPMTGIGINIDAGEWNDIHPGDKKTVGERLALQAMKLSYGEDELVASGPIFRSQEIRDHKIILDFDSVGSGLVTRNGEAPAHFAIAGEDKDFRWAEAVIEGDQVILWNENVPHPKYVRYAWADNPDFANLANEEGLPAAPFRTDR